MVFPGSVSSSKSLRKSSTAAVIAGVLDEPCDDVRCHGRRADAVFAKLQKLLGRYQ